VRLVGQWSGIERDLPEGWAEARLQLTVDDASQCDRAAALLGPTQPFRSEPRVLRFRSSRRGTAPSADGIRRLLRQLDRHRIRGTLELVSSEEAPAAVEAPRTTLAEAWDAELAKLPDDWSDAYAEVALLSTDYVDRGALLMAPLNPRREGGEPTFRFRSARRFGYGTSPEMVRRCFERCDAEQMRGTVRVLRALSDTDPVQTQGPVWTIAGRTI
jgi:hypothetical protein